MHSKNKKQQILAFLQQNRTCVLSTISPDGKPEAAVVEFVVTGKLELIFNTFTNYRKYRNLKINGNVAIVIGFGPVSVQYEGHAVEARGEIEKACRKLHTEHIKHKTKFHEMPETRYFKVSPRWIRYTDYSKKPWEKFAVSF